MPTLFEVPEYEFVSECTAIGVGFWFEGASDGVAYWTGQRNGCEDDASYSFSCSVGNRCELACTCFVDDAAILEVTPEGPAFGMGEMRAAVELACGFGTPEP